MMNGKFNKEESWEQQQVFDLENGFTVFLKFSMFYGESIARIDFGSEIVWSESSGISGLPSFAKNWIEVISNIHGPIARPVRPNFEKIFD